MDARQNPRQRGAEDGNPKKRVELVSARRDVALLVAEHQLSERQACRLLDLDRSTYRYEARPDSNSQLREALLALARQRPRYGYRRLWAILDRRGWNRSCGFFDSVGCALVWQRLRCQPASE
jgi:hypothetical protein